MEIKSLIVVALAAVLPVVGWAVEGLSPESEIWNAGVAAYEAGDLTNAVRVLRPLAGTKSHGARVAEIVAVGEFEAAKACAEDDLEGRLKHLTAAAEAAQTALRAAPADERLKKNLAEATADIARLSDGQHLKTLLEKAGKKSPQALVKAALASSRAGLSEAKPDPAKPASERLAAADALEARIEGIADACRVIAAKVSAQGQAADGSTKELLDYLKNLKALADTAARKAGDLSGDTESAAGKLEDSLTTLYRGILDAWSALGEDLVSQSNACLRAADSGGRSWQEDALAYSELFEARFPAWLQEYEQQCAASTNMPPFTDEMKVKAETLTLELQDVQKELCGKPTPEGEAKAVELIRELLAMMPRPVREQQQQQQQQDQEQDQQDQQQQQDGEGQEGEQKDAEQQEGKDQDADKQEGEDQKDAEAGEDTEEKEDEEEQEEGEEEQEPEAAEAEESDQEKADEDLLQRILERSAENKGKNKSKDKRPPTGSNRDW